jgi:hypothetical protein
MPRTTLAVNRRLDTTWDFRPGAEQIRRTVKGAEKVHIAAGERGSSATQLFA